MLVRTCVYDSMELLKPSESDKQWLRNKMARYCLTKSRAEAIGLLFDDFRRKWPEQILKACGYDVHELDGRVNWLLSRREAANERQFRTLRFVEELFSSVCWQAGIICSASLKTSEGITLISLASN